MGGVSKAGKLRFGGIFFFTLKSPIIVYKVENGNFIYPFPFLG